MRPVLGEIELPQVQQLSSFDRRTLATHVVAGHDASVLQNLGRTATRVLITGIASGPEAAQLTEKLGAALAAATPLDFVADVTADSHLEHVVVSDLSLTEVAGHPECQAYRIVLREYTEPPPKADPTALDTGILDDAAGLVGDLTLGLDGVAAFASGLTAAAASFGDLLARLEKVRQAASST
jgi:hypothetical protein